MEIAATPKIEPDEYSDKTLERVAFEALHPLHVSEELTTLHPLILATRDGFKDSSDSYRHTDLVFPHGSATLDISVAPGSVTRALRIWNAGMSYPQAFRRLVARQLTHIDPWWILDASIARPIMSGIKKRYPGTHLLPFAKREDNDDIACFELGTPSKVVIVHDFSSAGWERRQLFDDFYAWLRYAVEEMIEFDHGEDF